MQQTKEEKRKRKQETHEETSKQEKKTISAVNRRVFSFNEPTNQAKAKAKARTEFYQSDWRIALDRIRSWIVDRGDSTQLRRGFDDKMRNNRNNWGLPPVRRTSGYFSRGVETWRGRGRWWWGGRPRCDSTGIAYQFRDLKTWNEWKLKTSLAHTPQHTHTHTHDMYTKACTSAALPLSLLLCLYLSLSLFVALWHPNGLSFA